MSITEGETAPAFTLQATGGRSVSLKELKGSPFVLYFYPRADTPGCTREACAFQSGLPDFTGLGVTVIGVSKDSLPALEKFAAKYGLEFPLASDPEGTVIEAYGAWAEKMNYGRKYMGILRSTVLVDASGRIARRWPQVKVAGHAEAVLEAVRALAREP